jgi:hypothetical protein
VVADDEHGSVGHLLDEHIHVDVGRVGNELLLSVDESLQGAEDLLGRRCQLRHLRPVLEQPGTGERRIVGLHDLADLVECELEEAEPANGGGVLDLIRCVVAIARVLVDVCGLEQSELPVVAHGSYRQPGQTREDTDGEQLHVPSVGSHPTSESRPELDSRP